MHRISGLIIIVLVYSSCIPSYKIRSENKKVPMTYTGSVDSINSGTIRWKEFFKDSNLLAIIDTALRFNQELNIALQEINIALNDVSYRKGEYLPFFYLNAASGVEKTPRFTRPGAVEDQLEVAPGKEFPEPLPDYFLAARLSWEVDIWKKLRNARKAALFKYLGTAEGRNFMVSRLVAEIANSYYELMSLDKQLEILNRNLEIQNNALEIVRLQKDAAKVTELAVKKFEAELFKNQSRRFYILQNIKETENRLNFLQGKFPGSAIPRNSQQFDSIAADSLLTGLPSQLLANRPDIRQAEMQLIAAKLDVKATRANFYPSVRLTAGLGFQAFNSQYFLRSPESLLYSVTGDLIAPLINRKAIKALYANANAAQLQAVVKYEQSILNAYIEVVNQISKGANLKSSYELKAKEVEALTESIEISNTLFRSARADYMEVLMTQRDALEARFDLIEIKKQQMHSMVNLYLALGGGWN